MADLADERERRDAAYVILGDDRLIASATDMELLSALSNRLSRRVPAIPPLHLHTVAQLATRLCRTRSPTPNAAAQAPDAAGPEQSTSVYCAQQMRLQIVNLFVTAARCESHSIAHWFAPPPCAAVCEPVTTGGDAHASLTVSPAVGPSPAATVGSSPAPDAWLDHELSRPVLRPPSSQATSTRRLEDSMGSGTWVAHAAVVAPTVASLVAALLEALVDETLSLLVGEVLRLFLQHSLAFHQAFLAFRSGGAGQASFQRTAFGLLAPLLTDTSSALRNHAAWQVVFAAVTPDAAGTGTGPTRDAVELLARHAHAFLDLLVTCLRHANPASRRFVLRLVGDIVGSFTEWLPISHLILQSPAIFFSLLANTESPSAAIHETVYHIVKYFIMFPKKCPLMRHICCINRDALAAYVQAAAERYTLRDREPEQLVARLGQLTPLNAEEAALVYSAM